jgi:hypothetical protein
VRPVGCNRVCIAEISYGKSAAIRAKQKVLRHSHASLEPRDADTFYMLTTPERRRHRSEMSDQEVLSNQKSILHNQATILENQKSILHNQATIEKNQETLREILANQKEILKNQKEILLAVKK